MNAKDPIAFVPARQSRLGGGDIVISLTPEQSQKLGPDADMLADWFHSALWALATLRSAAPADQAVSPNSWHTMINDVDHRLLPRLEGIRDALIRAHAASGGSVGDLALAMDVARSTAQYRREVLHNSAPGTFEKWAVSDGRRRGGGAPQDDRGGQ
ncbi:hypothetical protein GCM10010331_74490 [Streptomyces xanthochromogenes]|uniref:hypothetical protein n=1 Tax=Streptomyces xanthochromogenes TaxID=67384 RepID=UPI001679E6D6|nr:hypothetical protein [Streptomyces xanthochromogenes]GHB75760.1 hypothetical protein GCM10010331_74490 [Streptomyces xanthochromogenes]